MELVLIQSGSEKRHTVRVGAAASVHDLLLNAAGATRCPLRTIRLFYSGRELKPQNKSLASFNVGKNGCNIIHMTTKVLEIAGVEELDHNTPEMNRSASSSSSGTLIDLTASVPVTTLNWAPPPAGRLANPRVHSSSSLTSIDLTANETSSPPPVLIGRATNILSGKRDSDLVTECPRIVAARLRRLDTQRLYCLEQIERGTAGSAYKQYCIMGSRASEFDVVINKTPSCTCQDANGPDAVMPCKHIIFVLVKVCKVHVASPLVYQTCFLQAELDEIFGSSSNSGLRLIGDIPGSSSSYSSSSSSNINNSSGIRRFDSIGSSSDSNNQSAEAGGSAFLKSGLFIHLKGRSAVHEILDDDIRKDVLDNTVAKVEVGQLVEQQIFECPICFEELTASMEGALVAPAQLAVNCSICATAVHNDCIKIWVKRSRTCPCCRSLWVAAKLSKKRKSSAIGSGRRGRVRNF